MIKRLIFDIDNTLIDWKEEYDEIIIPKAYEKIGMDYEEVMLEQTKNAINLYELDLTYTRYKEEDMNKFIEKEIGKKLTGNFIKTYVEISITESVPKIIEKEKIETIQYLSEKYELVALTNWFTWSQEERLKQIGIGKYFTQIYGAEDFDKKPSKESYEIAIGNNKKEECIIIRGQY